LYGVAKTGVDGMTRSFAAELAPYGVRVNAISPGWIETSPEETAAAQGGSGGEWELPPSLLNRMGTPQEIANVAAFLASDEASFVTGQTLVVDGGLMIMDYPSRPSLDLVGHRVFSHSAATGDSPV
jgi:NAD(P)-dependent dehydrogenase (short-subunit alcohol dehydrogenase family)